jgi:hypothetical protein
MPRRKFDGGQKVSFSTIWIRLAQAERCSAQAEAAAQSAGASLSLPMPIQDVTRTATR